MKKTVIFDSNQEWPTVGTSALIHGNEPFGGEVLQDFLFRVRHWELALNKWKLVAILEGNELARAFDERFREHDLNRVVNWVPAQEQRNFYEQERWIEIKTLIDRTEPSDWLDLHSFSAPNGLPYAFSSLHWYHKRWDQLWIQNIAVNMANANKKTDGGKLIWRWVADYVNDTWANGFTFEAWNHEDPECYKNTYQALINFLVSLDMLEPKRVEMENGETLLRDHDGIVKIWWTESSHVHIEEKHIFKWGFEYAGWHPQSFKRYTKGEVIWYDIVDEEIAAVVHAPHEGYIIMPKDPKICMKGKEVFYYWKDMSEV